MRIHVPAVVTFQDLNKVNLLDVALFGVFITVPRDVEYDYTWCIFINSFF